MFFREGLFGLNLFHRGVNSSLRYGQRLVSCPSRWVKEARDLRHTLRTPRDKTWGVQRHDSLGALSSIITSDIMTETLDMDTCFGHLGGKRRERNLFRWASRVDFFFACSPRGVSLTD